jgi:hypothetical protein
VTSLPGDSLLVLTLDPAFVLVGPTGEIVRKTPVDPARIRLPCVNPEGGLHLLSDRSLVVQSEVTGCGPRRDDLHRTNDLITHVRVGAAVVDTLGVFPGTERSGPRYRIFGRMLALAQAGDRVFIGDTGTDTIRALSLRGGGLAAVWRVPIEPRSVRDVDLPPRGPTYTLPDGSSARPPELVLPETYPLFGRLLTDGGGNLWVMRYPAFEEPVSSWQLKSLMGGWVVDPEGAEWIVLDHDGQTVARVRTPPGVMVLEIGSDYILGLSRDELDVESVSLYRLQR